MDLAAVGRRQAMHRREVVLVVVERGDRRRRRARRSGRGSRPSAPARAGWPRASGRCVRRTGRTRRRRRRRGRAPRRSSSPRCSHASRQAETVVRARRSGSSSRMWNIWSRAGSSDGSCRKHVRAARIDRHAAGAAADRARRSRGRPGSRRPARGPARSSLVARSSPRGATRARTARAACASVPSNAEDRAGQVREGLEVAAGLELAAREQRREAHRLGASGRPSSASPARRSAGGCPRRRAPRP